MNCENCGKKIYQPVVTSVWVHQETKSVYCPHHATPTKPFHAEPAKPRPVPAPDNGGTYAEVYAQIGQIEDFLLVVLKHYLSLRQVLTKCQLTYKDDSQLVCTTFSHLWRGGGCPFMAAARESCNALEAFSATHQSFREFWEDYQTDVRVDTAPEAG